MGNADDKHFDEYRAQTKIKHQILCAYLPAFFHIAKKYRNNLVFIDGFAGRGSYTVGSDQVPGSPLLALNLISSNSDLSKKVTAVFNEKDDEYYRELSDLVAEFHRHHPEIREPHVLHGRFSETVQQLLDELEANGKELAPTFMFVDPCGVDDVRLSVVANVLRRQCCEVLVFFNLDGVRRIIGLIAGGRNTPSLVALFGSQDRVDRLAEAIDGLGTSNAEEAIAAAYCDALRESGEAEYVVPFRVEAENKRLTSHYLIFATKHQLGFKIMKHVMWEAGRSEDGEEGRLELLQRSSGTLLEFMRADLEQLDAAVLAHLKKGPEKVAVFREEWVQRPDDLFTDAVYRRRLLAMEAQKKIVVLDDDCKTPLPASERKMTKAGRSLASRLFVRLP